MNLLQSNIFSFAKKALIFFGLFIPILFFSNQVHANCTNINSSFTTSQTIICGPGAQTISFVNTSGGAGAAAANYSWYLNGVLFSTTSGLAAPGTSNISAIGTYTYMLVAQDTGTLCLDTAIVTVFIRPTPVSSYTFSPNNACAGSTLNFTNTSTGTGAFTTYLWNFGDATTSTAVSPTHVYANGGTYNVTLTVTNGAGCVSTSTQTVTVLPRPNVNIAGDDGDGDTFWCLAPIDTNTNDLVTFFNLTTGGVSYSWNFGDGSPVFNTGSTASFTHNYNAYGTYTVTMTATGANGCTNSATLIVVFDKFVAASFSVPLAEFSGCAPHTVCPVNASQNADSYVWNFGDGSPAVTTSSFTPPCHTYTTGGSYTISLQAINSCNSSNSTVGPIVIVGAPIINFTATPALGCAPQTVTFGNTTTGASPINNYYWDFGNGNTLNGVKFPPPQVYGPGTWTIMLISGNACGTDTAFRTIVVDTFPTAIITVNPTIGCTPLTVSTVNNSIGGHLTYQWFIDGILTYTSVNIPNQVFTAPAGNTPVNHTIRLRVTNGCGFDDSLVTITVHPLVVANLTPVNSTICAGSSVTFTQNSQGTSLTYNWNFGNGNTSTSATPPAQTYPTAGTFLVSLIVTGFCGSDTAFGTVTVNPIPAAPTALGATICAGTSTTLTATAPGGTYQWYNAPAAGTLLFTGASYTTPVLGTTTTYYVQTTILGCTSARTPVTVTVNPIPVAPTAPGTTICAGSTATLTATAPGGSYQWFNAPVGGLLVDTGATITTPPLITTTTYYVSSTIGGCTGPRTPVTVTVNPIPAAPTAPGTSICTGNTATLTATAPGGTYQWYNLAVGGTLLQTGASYTTPVLTTTTTYYVQTTVAGCTSARTAVTVTVNPIPVADFTPSVIAGCQGLVVSFNNNSTLGGTYTWTFAGGVPATSALYTPPNVTFNTSGSNMVHLVVNVLGCINHDTAFINIAPLPTPAFTVLPNTGCAPVLSTINNTSGVVAGDVYSWNLGNGNTSSAFTPPAQNYTNTGTTLDSIYNIKLVITAANGCKDSVTHSVTVHPNPIAAFTPGPDTLCAGGNVVFTNSSVGSSTYSWNFGDAGTSTLTNPSHVYPTPGNYTVQLISSTAFACKDTAYQLVVVDTVPVAGFNNTTECLGFGTQFTNTSVGSIVSWNWNFGDGSPLGNTPSPLHNYASNGTYTVVLTVTNAFGCTNSVTHSVIVNPVPVTNFTNSTACLGTATTFTDLTSGSPINWIWNFGDATPTSNIQNPTHTYAAPGTYVVSLIAFGGAGCSDTIQHNVIVNPVPTSSFTFTSVCATDTTFFNSTSTGAPNTFVWNFGDGFTDNTNNPNPIHNYAIAGTYNVVLTTGYSATGCTNSVTVAVVSYPRTVPNFSSTTPCFNGTTTFTDLTTNAPTIWTWNFGDGSPTSGTQNPTHAYAAPGTYPVSLTTENIFGCVNQITLNAVVNPLPVAAFDFDTVCLNTATTFTDQSTSAVGWNWNFGDATTSTANSPTHIYATAGTYNVRLIVTNIFGCVDTIFHSIIVNPNPVSAFSATTACHTYPTFFTDNSTGQTGWNWNYGDGSPAGNIPNPTHTYASNGTYNVVLTVSNGFGCTNSITHSVLVNPVPIADFNNTTACFGQATNFTDVTTGTPVNWIWDFGDATPISNTQNPTHNYSSAGTYVVTLIAFGGAGCSDTIQHNVTVNPVPTSNFTFTSVCAADTTFFNSTSTGGPNTFAWNFGDGFTDITNNPNPIHNYALAGTYNVVLTTGYSATGCTNSVTIAVVSYPRTVPDFTSTTPCLNAATAFNDLTTNTPTIWTWDFGDATPTSGTQNPTHTYAAPGTYPVTLTTENVFGCVDVITMNTVVNPLPVAAFNFDTVCLNTTTTFTDQSTSAVGWNWDFGDGGTAASNSPTHTYATAGTFNVRLIVTNVFGCVDTIFHNIIVNPNPVSSYTATTACHTYPTFFTDLSTGPVAWSWDFGDASPLDATQSPQHLYANPGNYNVDLLVTNIFGCTNLSTQTITVLPQPQANFTFSTVCAGQSVTFTDQTVGAAMTSWTWDFGDGTPGSSAQNPNHMYTTGGNYNTTLISQNSSGCADTVIIPVVVNSVPVPLFTATTTCQGNFTSFTDLSTDVVTISNWFYDFDDGNNSLSQNPNYIFLAAGTYNVSLTVTNINGCDSTFILPVVVNVVPVANYVADTVCIGSPTTFTDLSTGLPNSWTWDFGDGNTSTVGPNETHTYLAAGSYLTSLTVSNGPGCSDQTFRVVQVIADVAADINAPNAACINSVVTINDASTITSGFIAGSSWDFGDGSPIVNALNTTHTYTSTGTFIITHYVSSNGGCVSIAIDTIVINPLPVADFTTANTCQIQPSTFTDISTGPAVTWNWDFGDTSTDNIQNPTHVYSTFGTYNVTLIITDANGCGDTVINPVTVYGQPSASFTNNIVCWGDITTFNNTSSTPDGTIVSTAWDFGDGVTSGTYDPTHTFVTLNDSFTVSLIITTSLGCIDTATQLVTTLPIIDFNFGPTVASGCEDFTSAFADLSTVPGGTIVNYLWDFGDSNFTYTANPAHTYYDAGTYTVVLTLTSSYGCTQTDTLNYPVIVYPRPVAEFTADPLFTASILTPTIDFINQSTGSIAWDWNFGNNNSSVDQNPVYVYPDTGTYLVTLIAYNQFGCTDTVWHPVNIYGETTLFIPNAFSPNGTELNELWFPVMHGYKQYNCTIYDRWGLELWYTEDQSQGWNGIYDDKPLPQDVYTYKIFVVDGMDNAFTYYGRITLLR